MSEVAFKKKCLLPSQRICLRLRQLREEKNWSLDTLSKKTRINKSYLLAIEECRFDDINCSEIYLKNFIKKYVEALGHDAQPFVTQFCKEETCAQTSATTNMSHKRISLYNVPRIIRIALSSVGVAMFLLYLGIHVHNILQPPFLLVVSPTDGDILRENTVTLKGKTDPETKVSINDTQITYDELGNFEENIILRPGINALVITAQNKHGKTTTETYHVIYKDLGTISQK